MGTSPTEVHEVGDKRVQQIKAVKAARDREQLNRLAKAIIEAGEKLGEDLPWDAISALRKQPRLVEGMSEWDLLRAAAEAGRFDEIEAFFEDQIKKILHYWRTFFARSKGRPESKAFTELMPQIEALRLKKRSWHRIAKMLAPAAYAKDAQGTANNIRLNYRYRLKKRQTQLGSSA